LNLTTNLELLRVLNYNETLTIRNKKSNNKEIIIKNFDISFDLLYDLKLNVKAIIIDNKIFFDRRKSEIEFKKNILKYDEIDLLNNINIKNNKSIKTINCLNKKHFICGNFDKLNKITVKDADYIYLNGTFNNNIIIYGNIKHLVINGKIKNIIIKDKIEIIKFIKCENVIGDFKNCKDIYCCNCINIFGNFNNLHINNCNYLNIICNTKLLHFIGKKELKINNFFCNINILKLININIKSLEKIFNNISYINLNELEIKNSNIRELNDKLINLKVLELNNCKKLFNLPIYNNLEKLIINDCKNLLFDLNNYPNVKEYFGNYFEDLINKIKEKINNLNYYYLINNFSYLLNQ